MKKGNPNYLRLYRFIFAFILFSPIPSWAQIEITPATTGFFTTKSLVSDVFLGDGVEVLSIDYSGADEAVGFFEHALDDIGIESGIIMTTGNAVLAQGNNSSGGSGFNNQSNSNTCTALDNITSQTTLNTAFYSITFIPISDTLRFKYVFASEEYPEFACDFNDVFGFFLTGPNPSGGNYNQTNIALVPDTTDLSGTTFTDVPVTINNVNEIGCNNDFGDYYYNNNIGGQNLQYDGYLDVFIAQAIVVPCQEYTIKLAIADVGDGNFDTGVFLEAKSFGTQILKVELATASLDCNMAEGCADGALTFTLPYAVSQNYPVDYTILGTAINGVDYETIPTNLTIPADSNSVSFPIVAISDNLVEPVETFGISVQQSNCRIDTFWINIQDNNLVAPVLRGDATVCPNAPVALDGTLQITVPTPPIFTFEDSLAIDSVTEAGIEVFGLKPTFLQRGVIKQVCIDTLLHPFDDDLSIYLIAPSGQFIELSTRNGGNGMNYIGTCFTPNATTRITDGGTDPNSAPASEAPFTGEFLPEGVFADLWEGEQPTNGTWRLYIEDRNNVTDAYLLKWSIHFESLYGVNYDWSPTTGLDCSNCPNPNASPAVTTTYALTATDSYGCEVFDSVTINILNQLPAPIVNCTNITNNSITYNWAAISGASAGYEVSLDGGTTWIPNNNGSLSHIISGLSIGTNVPIEVRANDTCPGAIGSQACNTLGCVPPILSVDMITDANCFGDSSGAIQVSGNGNNPPFTFTLDTNSNITGTYNGLTAGTYEVFINDATNCETSTTITVGQPDSIMIDLTILEVQCNGGNEGTASIDEISYGATTANINDFNISWSNGQSGNQATNLIGGNNYIVTVTDQLNCMGTASFSMDNPGAIIATITDKTDVNCSEDQTGTATVSANGGTIPFTYLWSNSANAQTTKTAINLSLGTHTVTVSDANNCTTMASVTIETTNQFQVVLEGINVLCKGESQGVATAMVSGGMPPYFYEWSNGTTTQSNEFIIAGNYQITVTDGTGCKIENQIEITEPTEFLTVTEQHRHLSCWESGDGLIDLDPSGGTPPYTYSLDGLNYNGADKIPGLDAGAYFPSIIDVNGCISQNTDTINLYQPQPIEVEIFGEQTILFGEVGFLFSNVTNQNGEVNYFWSPADNLNCSVCPNPRINGLEFQTSYTLIVVDENGCEGEDTHLKIVRKERNVFVPTGFSPNGDGINDLLYVVGQDGVTIITFNVYDRWGELVHQSLDFDINDETIGWDGNFRSQEMPSGVYLWTCEVVYGDGTSGVHQGQSSLLR